MRAALLLLGLLSCSAATAGPPPIEWFCSIDNSVPAVICVRDDPQGDETATVDEIDDGGRLRQALFAPGKPPCVTRVVREQPKRFAHPFWTIPLFSPATDDDEFVATLAQSVMCGREADCRAHLLGKPSLHASLR